MNNISLIGRLTKDIELSTTSGGVNYTRFNIAVASELKDQDDNYQTDFFTCVAWREQAETLAKYVKKGNQIGIMGAIHSRNYEKDGIQRTIWEVNVKGITFVGNRDSGESQGEPTPPPANKKAKGKTNPTPPPLAPPDDDLPF